MQIYQIIGLKKTDTVGTMYITDSRGRILHDENNKAKIKERTYTEYVIYVDANRRNDQCIAIRLYETSGASFGGIFGNSFIYYMGNFEIRSISVYSAINNINYWPIHEMSMWIDGKNSIDGTNIGDIENLNMDEIDDMEMYLDTPTDIRVVRYSRYGSGSESIPDGYIIVNMDLFSNKPVYYVEEDEHDLELI